MRCLNLLSTRCGVVWQRGEAACVAQPFCNARHGHGEPANEKGKSPLPLLFRQGVRRRKTPSGAYCGERTSCRRCRRTQKDNAQRSPRILQNLGKKLVTDLSAKPRFRKNRSKAEYKALAFCKKCGIMCILFNMGVFQDSPGVEGDSISVSQRLLRTKAKLN